MIVIFKLLFCILAQRIHYFTLKIHTALGVILEEPNAFIWRWHVIPECMEIGRITFFVASKIEAAECAEVMLHVLRTLLFSRHTYPSCIYVIRQDFFYNSLSRK